MDTMFRKTLRKGLSWSLMVQMLWASVYLPASAQVPPAGEEAGDWQVYKQSLGTSQEAYVNLLIILDTSDSMNQPESWRPYPGSYNSHVEYLWNDPIYISKIQTTNPPAPTSTSLDSRQVRIGYFTYLLENNDANITNETAQNDRRQVLKQAALSDATTDVNLSFPGGNQTVPKWLYRNYGGPMEFAFESFNTYRWFNSSWIYFVPSALNVTAATLANSPYLYSTSLSKFLGANNQSDVLRASIYYRGQANDYTLSVDDRNVQFNSHARYDGIDYEKFNTCDMSRYDERVTKLTGLGVVASGIKASTVFMPATPGYYSKQVSGGAQRDTTAIPMVGFNSGYAKNLHYVRFDPYFDSTQTRNTFINNYPGPGEFDNPAPETWPPTNADFNAYHSQSGNMRFNPAYFDFRCYTSTKTNPFTEILDTTKFFKNGCNYEFKNTPRRDNFGASGTSDRNNAKYFGLVNGDGTTSKAPVLGMNGLPIRVLRYKFVPDAGDAPSLPSTRKLTLRFGPCANTGGTTGSSEFGPGGYNDYVCRNASNTSLYMTWSGIRSDLGGFNYAYALYDLFASLKKPDTSYNPTDLSNAERETILNNILSPYGVRPLAPGTRWNTLNNGTQFNPSALSQWMFAGYLGTRDCYDIASNSFTHCSGVNTATEELATGVSGYVDYTRTTYNYCVKPDGTASYTDSGTGPGCYSATTGTPIFSRTNSGEVINPYYSLDSGASYINSASVDVGSSTSVILGPQPNNSLKWLWFGSSGIFGGTTPANANRQQTITGISGKTSKVGVVWSANGAATTGVMEIKYNGNVCARSAASASQSSVDGGATWQNTNTLVAKPTDTVIFRPSPATGTWYWVGDNNFVGTATAGNQFTLPATEISNGANRQYFGINFDIDGCASVATYNVISNSSGALPVRSNTYAVNDPNINGVIAARNDTITSGISGDVSDTLGLVAQNVRSGYGDDNNLFYGAIPINDGSVVVPPGFKQYKRTASCTADPSSMDFVWADNPGTSSSTNFYFNHPNCLRQDPSGSAYSSSSLSTCLVSTGGGAYTTVTDPTEFSANCAGLPESTCTYYPPSTGNARNINVFNVQGCGMFTFTSGYEGGGSSAAGKTCGLVANGNYYVIDHDHKGTYDPANPGVYQGYESSWLSLFLSNRGVLNTANQPLGRTPNNYYGVTSLTGGYAPLTPAKNMLKASPQICSQINSPNRIGATTPEGFSPVYYESLGGGTYNVFNAQNGYSCGIGTLPFYAPHNEVTPPTTNVNANSYFLSINGPVTGGGAFGTGTTNTEATNAKNTGDVGSCRPNEPYSAGYSPQPRDAALAPTEVSHVRLFEAYNVLKYGSSGQPYNSSLYQPSAGGGVFPHFVYACTDANSSSPSNTVLPLPAGLGKGSRSNWDTSGNEPQFFRKFDLFQDAKANIRNYVYPAEFLESEPALSNYKGLFDVGSNVSSSATQGSQVDLYSVNYLNFVFGPKYNGSPIGRRTRFQLAQDTLAEIISSTTSQIRIGLMFFNQPDAAGLTNGGYVAKRIASLGKQICPKTTINMAVSADGRTLTSVASVDSWFDRVPTPTGSATIPQAVTTSLVKGGTIQFPANGSGLTFLPIAMTGIDDNGTITLDSPADASFFGRSVIVTMENCNLANYPGLTGHRADLVNTLYRKRATSQTPLTETLYEAYLYFNGGTPKFGKYVTSAGTDQGSPEADITNAGDGIHPAGAFTDSSYTRYLSPMSDLVDSNGRDYGKCSNNNILLITDGYSFGDYKANNEILGLPDSNGTSITLSGISDANQKVNSSVQTVSGLRSANQFRDATTSVPFGPYDSFPTASNTYSLFDELAYYLGNANIAPASLGSNHSVKLYTAALDIKCSPVVENGIFRNRGGQCTGVNTSSGDLVSVIENLLSSLNNWVPSVNVAAIPLPVQNRSSSSVESYMGLFAPSGSRVWRGNMKKYQLAFGPAECGVDSLGKPIDGCLTGKNVLYQYRLGNVAVNSRNIFTRPSSADDVSIAKNATDYWSTTDASINDSGEGTNVNQGGIVSQLIDKGYPAGTNTYTFLPAVLPSNVMNPSLSADLTATVNQVSNSNTLLSQTSNFGEVQRDGTFSPMPASSSPNEVINFMLGASSSTPSVEAIRNTPHGDVMHSAPTSIVYKAGAGSYYSRVYYLSGLGDLVSVNDQSSNSGKVAWRFYPFEAVKRQYEIMRNYNVEGADLKIFGADGGVSSLIFDKNADGYIDPTNGDKAYIAFGMRRGGRAIYVLDVTNPDAPKIQWTMNNESICKPVGASGTLTCSTAANFLASNPGIPANMFSELGYTWSTPLMGFVNAKPKTNGDAAAFVDTYNIKRKTPVVAFGGGYDPEEDKQVPDPTNFTMGRALYVMEALTGTPLKIWSRNNQIGGNSVSGIMVKNNGGFAKSTCKAELPQSSNPFYYPIASAIYGMNVDYDGANTFDRLYVGDLGGQLFRFDIGTLEYSGYSGDTQNLWRGTKMGEFNGRTTSTEFDLTASSNKTTINGVEVYKRSRKFLQPPVVATWSRNTASNKKAAYHYIYGVTGDIEHPWQTGVQDLAFALVDTETAIDMKCAPKFVGQVGNVLLGSNNNADISLLPDITLEGRVDLGSKAQFGVTDKVIDIYDIPPAANLTGGAFDRRKVSRENLTRAIDFTKTARLTSGVPNFTFGLLGWYYRMEADEKGVAGARVINGQFTWTGFAAGFQAGLCSRGTGTKYYLDAYNGSTVDTNFDGKASDLITSSDGKASNCLQTIDYYNAYNTSLLTLPTGSSSSLPSTTIQNATNYDSKLRTPVDTSVGAGGSQIAAGLNSRQCDSPRPIYNTSYGLLQNDVQVAHDGVLYRVGFVPNGNSNDYAYDDGGGLLGFNNSGSYPSTLPPGVTAPTNGTKVINATGSKTTLETTATSADGTGTSVDTSAQGAVAAIIGLKYQTPPAQVYWYRDDLH